MFEILFRTSRGNEGVYLRKGDTAPLQKNQQDRIIIIFAKSIMSTFSFLKPANQLWKDSKVAKVKARILERVSEIPHEARENKHSTELLLLVCNMIEHSIDNKGKKDKLKIDKKSLLVAIYGGLFGNLSPADCEMLSKNIEFLHDNGHIHRQSAWKVCVYGVVDWVKRKVL